MEPGLDSAQDASDRRNGQPRLGDEDEGPDCKPNHPGSSGLVGGNTRDTGDEEAERDSRDLLRLPTSGDGLVARASPETTAQTNSNEFGPSEPEEFVRVTGQKKLKKDRKVRELVRPRGSDAMRSAWVVVSGLGLVTNPSPLVRSRAGSRGVSFGFLIASVSGVATQQLIRPGAVRLTV